MNCNILSNNKITDNEFLNLMIKHHNVAIKMSQLVMITSTDDIIIDFARKTIFNQSNEVFLMEKLLVKIPNMQNEKSCNCGNTSISAQLEKIYPNIFSNLKCNENHFDKFVNIHSLVLDINDTISDEQYIVHMIEHHKSGIDLANLEINSTKEPKLLMLAQTILLDQEKELFMIKNLIGSLNNNWRKIIY